MSLGAAVAPHAPMCRDPADLRTDHLALARVQPMRTSMPIA
jgi:hypothetical protein